MRCPVCRAENDAVTCRRCKADLSLMTAVEQARVDALTRAANAAALGDGREAGRYAQAAHRLRAEQDSWRWLAIAALLERDFAKALAYHQQAASASPIL